MVDCIREPGFRRALFTLVLATAAVALATQEVQAAPLLQIGYCQGTEVDVWSTWPGIAEGTVGVCGTLTYHSTAVGLYGGPPPTLYRPQIWLQSGENPLQIIKHKTTFRTSCQRANGLWRWQRRAYSTKVKTYTEQKFLQKYGPDVDAWEWAVTGDSAECRSEPGARVFYSVDTLWNLKEPGCDVCGTWQHIEKQ